MGRGTSEVSGVLQRCELEALRRGFEYIFFELEAIYSEQRAKHFEQRAICSERAPPRRGFESIFFELAVICFKQEAK